MNKFFITLTIIFFTVLLPVNVLAKDNKRATYQAGTIQLKDGVLLNGQVKLKKSFSDYEIIFKKSTVSSKEYSYLLNQVEHFSIGEKVYEIAHIISPKKNYVTVILEKIVGQDAVLYNAKYIDKFSQGKNNSTNKEVITYLLVQNDQYTFLNEKDYKNKLGQFWSDDAEYLDKLTQYDKINKETLEQILID